MKDPGYENFEEAADDIYRNIAGMLSEHKCKYAFYGHSMGALLSYAVAVRLERNGYKAAEYLFLSGRPAPNFEINKDKGWSTLPDQQLKLKISSLGGNLGGVFDNERLASLYLKRCRMDYKVLESYRLTGEYTKLSCDLAIFYGLADELTRIGLDDWNKFTDQGATFYSFEGGHFFNIHHESIMLQMIESILLEKLKPIG